MCLSLSVPLLADNRCASVGRVRCTSASVLSAVGSAAH